MLEPLLTIEDATREYRVSPKTIRRRLSAGEIDGAYKRPGQRGPEWVIPRGALEAAGFARRIDVPGAELPDSDAARADYWERRALDAEAALRSARADRSGRGGAGGEPAPGDRADELGGGSVPEPPVVAGVVPPTPVPVPGLRPATITVDQHPAPASRAPQRGRLLAVGLATLVVALLVGALALAAGDEGPEPSPSARGPAATVEAVLGTITDPGDPVGVVGDAARRLLPDGRRPVPASRLADEGGRYLLAAFDAPREPTAVVALRRSAAVVLDLSDRGGTVVVFDTGAVPGAPDAGADGTERPGSTGPAGSPTEAEPTDPTASATDDAGALTGEAVSPAEPWAAPAAPGTVVVQVGESFWTIAVDLVAASGGSPDAGAVTSVWSALVAANADRLVEPGNPDLLHVGQTLVVPGG